MVGRKSGGRYHTIIAPNRSYGLNIDDKPAVVGCILGEREREKKREEPECYSYFVLFRVLWLYSNVLCYTSSSYILY